MSRRMKPSSRPSFAEPESLAELLGDCIRMARRWPPPVPHTPPIAPPPVTRQIRGIRVSDRSARLLDGISDYGD